jgi:hypothetical protein
MTQIKNFLFLLFLGNLSLQAQKGKIAPKPGKNLAVKNSKLLVHEQTILIGGKPVTVKGLSFNVYNRLSDEQTISYQYHDYYYRDPVKKTIVITEVFYELQNTLPETKSIETYTIPVNKLNKKDSYILEMIDPYFEGGKYFRISLLNDGTNQNYFKESVFRTGETEPEVNMVSFVTISLKNKETAEKYLKEFTK